MTSPRTAGSLLAYTAFYIAAFGVALVLISDPTCRFVGSATQDYTSDLTEPAHTGTRITFFAAPLLAIAAIVLLRRAEPRPSRLAWAAAIGAFAVTGVEFFLYLGKAAFACGVGL